MKKRLNLMMIYSLILILTFSGMSGFASGFNTNQENDNVASIYLEVDETSSDRITVIVELDEQSIVEAKHKGKFQTRQNLKAERNRVVADLKKVAASSKVNREYDYVFSGFSLEIAQNEVVDLLGVSGVKAVYPNVTYQATTVGEAELLNSETFSPAMLDSAPFIGSDKAWDAGFTGEGIVVAVLDTGVDYTHPDLAHAFGEYKGWDFVDNNDDPQETFPGDPRGGATTHGTHVAGTIAANGAIKGVAPNATLLSYRVLGPGGSGTTENVVAGIERAVQDGADVMNLSLGNTLNNPDWATSIALDWAMAEGVVAVTSNGNSGPNNWTVGSPGTSREAISVGATQLPYNIFSASIFTSEGVEYPSAKVMGYQAEEDLLSLKGNTYEFVDVGLGYPQDFEGKDLEGKIALISRGEFAFVDKASNAKEAGAVGALIYNHLAGDLNFNIPGMAVPTIQLTNADGKKLLAELEAGNNEVTFDIEFVKAVGETMAAFSSRGPVMNTWMIKPDVSAPGVAIVSTVPTFNEANPHGYASKQGTSMSAPHVAGAVALMLEANPDWGVDFVKAALMNTAEKLYDENGKLYPHNSQGAGSIRVLDAITADTIVTPGSHSFGIFAKDNGQEVRNRDMTIHNLSNERKRYTFEVQFPEGINVRTSNNLNVQANGTQTVDFRVRVDASITPGYYEGTITVRDGKNSFVVPTILFVQQPDYPMLNSLSLALSGGNLVGTVNVPGGAEVFNLRIRNADTGELLAEPARVTNVPVGTHSFSWNMTINGEPLTPGRYQINAYARTGTNEMELVGGVLTINP